MSVTLYVWQNPSLSSMHHSFKGHVALRTPNSNGSDPAKIPERHRRTTIDGAGYYVSFYPNRIPICKGKDCDGAHFHTQEIDGIGLPNREQPEIRQINGLRIEAINQLFIEFAQYPCWGALGSGPFRKNGELNCASLSERLLREGGIYQISPLMQVRTITRFFNLVSRMAIPFVFNHFFQNVVNNYMNASSLLRPAEGDRLKHLMAMRATFSFSGNAKVEDQRKLSQIANHLISILGRAPIDRILLFLLTNQIFRRATHQFFAETITPPTVLELANRVDQKGVVKEVNKRVTNSGVTLFFWLDNLSVRNSVRESVSDRVRHVGMKVDEIYLSYYHENHRETESCHENRPHFHRSLNEEEGIYPYSQRIELRIDHLHKERTKEAM